MSFIIRISMSATKKTTSWPKTVLNNSNEHIVLQWVSTHNLKNIDVTIPKNKLITITWVSGSWKSSLAFHTIYKEGQFRYIESLSSYLRQFFQLWSTDLPALNQLIVGCRIKSWVFFCRQVMPWWQQINLIFEF